MKSFIWLLLKTLGVLVLVALLWFAAGVAWPLGTPEPNPRATRLLVTGVSVVDVERGVVDDGQSLLIEGGEIVAVGTGLDPEGAEVLDGSGRYAIPGLFDMHVHSMKLSPTLTHPLFIAAGVTAVRDMGGCIGIADAWVACVEDKRGWDRAVRAGRIVGPRYDRVTSLAMNGGSEIPNSVERSIGGATPQGARARAIYDAGRDIDFLKPYNDLPRDSYLELADAARDNGLYLAGHLPLAVSGLEAVSVGQRSFEHALVLIWECYRGIGELRGAADPWRLYDSALRLRMIEEHDAALCATLQAEMVKSGTVLVPTHTTRKLDAYAADQAFRTDPRLRYIPSPLRTLWLQDADRMIARGGVGGADSYRAIYEFGLEQTGVAHRAGVTVLAGTDAPDSFVFPGSSLHDELEHLVRAGLSPADALRAATVRPAHFLGLAGRAGVLAAGARADVVLLEANPLEDIRAVRMVDTVVLAGTVYDRTDLDAMLSGVEQAAGHWSMWPKFAWQIVNSPIMRKQFAD